MRYRPAPTPSSSDRGGPPPELRVGPEIGTWASDGRDPRSAFRAFSRARLAWAEAHSMKPSDLDDAVVPRPSWLWSAAFLLREGRGDELDARLTRAGVTRADLPRLRAAAEHWHRAA